MSKTIEITPKQAEYAREATHRWNFAVGAVRSGKSHMAIQYTIPRCLTEGHGKKGLNLILGATRENIERNVLTPMRDIWGYGLVSEISQTHGTATLFGEKVYCMGGEDRQVASKIRGSEVKFCYCDEIADIHIDVFEMLKSRLSLPYSQCHAACNPSYPSHFIKRFIDSREKDGIDIYYQHYTIYDNPFLPESYVRSLEAEYQGTVFYDRYIRGLWTQAEGLIYPEYEKCFEPTYEGPMLRFCVSCDYGTQNAFAALKWAYDGSVWHCIDEYRYSGREQGHQKTDADYVKDMVEFTRDIPGTCEIIVDPSATSFIAALRRCEERSFKPMLGDNAVLDGIRDVAVCIQTGLIKVSRKCNETYKEFSGYVWDDRKLDDVPFKENDHMMDALRYFVKTKRVYVPKKSYTSVLEGLGRRVYS